MAATTQPHRMSSDGICSRDRRARPGGASLLLAALLAAAAPPPLAADTTASLVFTVRHYAISGDSPLSAGTLDAILAPYTGDSVSLDDLEAAAAALERALHEAGHVLTQVIVPPQEIAGTATLEILRFTIGELRIAGNQHFDADNIRRALPALAAGSSPGLPAIARAQLLANEHPARQLTVVLLQGQLPDTVDAGVRVQDVRPWGAFASVDDTGTDETGQLRTGFGVQHSNLFNRDHALTATYTGSPGHWSDVRQYGVYYRAPFYTLGGAFSAYYTYSDSNFGTVARFFEVRGRGRFIGVRWSQHLAPLGAYRHQAELGLEDRAFDNELDFAGSDLGTDLRSRPVLARYTGTWVDTDFQVQHAVELAVNSGSGGHNDAAAYRGNRAGAKPAWQALRFALDGARPLGGWVLGARLRAQFSEDALTAGEQLGLGGAAGVRGLNERNTTGDSGVVVSGEALSPPFLHELRALAFVDTGQLWQNHGGGVDGAHGYATSVGLGMRWSWRTHLSLAADWAYVVDGADGADGSNRGHLALLVRY